ncbi:MAG TPA: hypothetical protein VL991_03110 [Terracidiphilus sp.]|jgi:hypothetical protein|nr:hypothetical protein [Terracidiphilus sp.]
MNDGMKSTFRSYFYWTHARGSVQYDVMVTLILAFIFITPHLWNYGDKPSNATGPNQPIEVVGNDGHGLVITVQAADVNVLAAAPDAAVKKALRKAIEPVTGDAVSVDRWELSRDANGNPVSWKVWVRR